MINVTIVQLLKLINSPVQNLLYLSTMHPSRLAKFISLATSRYLAAKPQSSSYLTQWTKPQLNVGLNRTNRYWFALQETARHEDEAQQTEGKDFSHYITDQSVLSKLRQNGITKMFPVQEETFRLIEAGKDVLASDRTGSGKTLGYTLPVLEKFNKAKYNLGVIKAPKFLILCPTRQLVLQVTSEISKFNSTYKVVSVYGGSSIERQISEINRGVAIVVATPGRLIDLLQRKAVNFNDLEVVCIDEADTMLQKGFKDDVEEIFGYIRGAAGKTQNIMFSATIPSWVTKIAREYFNKDMERINMIKDESVRTSQTVEHLALYVKRHQRHGAIRNLIQKYNPNSRTIIFTQTKAEANDFIKEFDSKHIVILHGDIPQSTRESNLRDFRSGHKKLLIATDVAARGIDIPDVQLIIQLSPPENPEPYIHRSGRTGRAGKEGTNITFFDESNISDLIQVEKAANIKIKMISNNYNVSFWQNKLKKMLHKIETFKPTKNQEVYEHFLDEVLRTTPPKLALLYLLKEHMGTQPEATSVLNQKKGFVTYIAYQNPGKNTKLSDVFKEIGIHHESVQNQGIKFDIAINDFYKFEEIIEKQDDFEIEPLDENNRMTLSLYAKKIRRGSSFSIRDNRDNDRRGSYNRDGREDRYERNDINDKSFRRERDDRSQRPERTDRNDRTKSKREDTLPPEGLSVYRVFLYGFSPEVKEKDMKEEIIRQADLTNFKLKVLKKLDESGNVSKTFGFIQFSNRDECIKFMETTVVVNGETIKSRLAQDRM